MSNSVPTVDDCPRDVESLSQLSDAVLYRLAMQLGMFPDQTFCRGLSISDQEALFIEHPKKEKAELLAVKLAFRDGAQR